MERNILHYHGHHSDDKPPASGKRLLATIIFNLVITVAEYVGGLITGYLALVADATHNLSDVAALGLAWLGMKGAEQPATKRSTYGYKRVEVLTAFVSAVALVVIAVFLVREAVLRYLDPRPILQPAVFLTVAIIGLLGNVLSVWLLQSEKGKSLNMRSAFLHMFYDAVSSAAVIAGAVVIWMTGWVTIDVLLTVLISLMIFWSSYGVIKEAVLILMESVPQGIEFDEVLDAIEKFSRVKNVHDLHIWSLSSTDIALSCHVCVSADDYSDGPDIMNEINDMLDEKFGIGHGTIQVETEDCHRPHKLCQ